MDERYYLVCERKKVFELLMLAAGMMGVYTYALRGGVFCNAQTANFVMMAIALGNKNWSGALYFIIPISAYLAGAILSEWLPGRVRRLNAMRWDTYLIAFEIAVLIIVGFIPLSANHHIVQVMINFICSMQYNTFRQAESIPMATTFCTNHVRQTGINVVKYIKTRDFESKRRILSHFTMLISFLAGGVIEMATIAVLSEKAIWVAAIPLLIDLFFLARADMVEEKGMLEKIPEGH